MRINSCKKSILIYTDNNFKIEKHYSKTSVFPVAEMQIFPDFEVISSFHIFTAYL